MALLCSHPDARDRQVCVHLAADDDLGYLLRFTGVGTDYQLVCKACADAVAPPLAWVCAACVAAREAHVFDALGVRGRPEVKVRASSVRFETPVAMAWSSTSPPAPSRCGSTAATTTRSTPPSRSASSTMAAGRC